MRTTHGNTKKTNRSHRYRQAVVVYRDRVGVEQELVMPCESGYFNGRIPTGLLFSAVQDAVGEDLSVLLNIKPKV